MTIFGYFHRSTVYYDSSAVVPCWVLAFITFLLDFCSLDALPFGLYYFTVKDVFLAMPEGRIPGIQGPPHYLGALLHSSRATRAGG